MPLQSLFNLAPVKDFKDASLHELTAALIGDNFDPYLTSVGGSGLGILSPYGQRGSPDSAPATPPETPNGVEEPVEAAIGAPPDPLRASFETKTIAELAAWAERQGKWLFV